MALLIGGGRLRRWFLAAALAVLGPAAGFAQGDLEAKVKAAFVYNFAKFVTWPAESPGASLDVCVADAPALAEILESSVRGKEVRGMRVEIRRLEESGSAEGCEIAYVGTLEAAERLSLAELAARDVLAVGHDEAFLPAGGTINFVVRDNKLGFQINRAAVEAGSLTLSSKLLQLAEIYGDGP